MMMINYHYRRSVRLIILHRISATWLVQKVAFGSLQETLLIYDLAGRALLGAIPSC
jgi:hypothetical protein